MKRILCIVGSMNPGGAETFLMKIYRQLDKTRYQMDFAVGVREEAAYDREILEMGGRIFHITPKTKGMLQNFRDIQKLVKKEGYESVLRISQSSISALELLAARLGGARHRGFRSSNSSTVSGSRKSLIVHKLGMVLPRLCADIRFAPSTEAAEFMFGKGCIQKGRAVLLHNAIQVEQFAYNGENRETVRRELGLENKLVVGHVGRLSQQKNHGFLLEVFAQIAKERPQAMLLLVGTGELEQSLRDRAQALGIGDRVVFAGMRRDVPAVLSAMDLFVFPSLYEGMPNTVIEAQANGLPCLISDTITREANITGLVQYLPLSLPPERWAQKALGVELTRQDQKENFIRNGYEIAAVAREFIGLMFPGEEA